MNSEFVVHGFEESPDWNEVTTRAIIADIDGSIVQKREGESLVALPIPEFPMDALSLESSGEGAMITIIYYSGGALSYSAQVLFFIRGNYITVAAQKIEE